MGALAASIALWVARTAHGDPASDLASEAERLAKAQDYDQAAAKFRAAYRLDPRAEYLCNVGVSYQRAKALPHAQIYLGECLVRGNGLDAAFITLVRDALTTVEDKLRGQDFTPVEVAVTPQNAIISIGDFDADETFVGSRVIWLPFGKHTITASAESYTSTTHEIDASGHDRRQLRFDLVKLVVHEPPKPPSPQTIVHPPPSKTLPIVTSAITVAVAAVGVGFWIDAYSVMDGAKLPMPYDQYKATTHKAFEREHTAWALEAAAAAGAVASALLWYRATRPPAIEILPASNGVAVAWSGAW
jgi:hypothetical protein